MPDPDERYCTTHERPVRACVAAYFADREVDFTAASNERRRCSDMGGADWKPPPPPVVVSRTEKHDVSSVCSGLHCWEHDVDEVGPGYIRCGECYHVWPTAAALLLAHNLLMARVYMASDHVPDKNWITTNPRVVYSCPGCSHDF